MKCIFGDADQWASVRRIDPAGFYRIADIERDFDYTIDRKLSVVELADRGESFVPDNPALVRLALGLDTFTAGMFILPAEAEWTLPLGAFKRCAGPS